MDLKGVDLKTIKRPLDDLGVYHLSDEIRKLLISYLESGNVTEVLNAKDKIHTSGNSSDAGFVNYFYTKLYNEEVYTHAEIKSCPLLYSQLVESKTAPNGFELAKIYVNSLKIANKYYNLYIMGFEIIFGKQENRYTSDTILKKYLWKVFYADNEAIWTKLTHAFFSLYLLKDSELDEDLKVVLRYTNNLDLRNEVLKPITDIIIGLLDEQIMAHKNVHNKPSLDECLNFIKSNSIIRLNKELSFEHINHYIMEKIMLDKFHEMRYQELFNIVKAFAAGEDVQYAIYDMKRCTSSPRHRDNMKKNLIKDFKSRLLHSSVGTNGIITYLVSLKMVLDIVDPTSHVLNSIIEPVRDYLHWRKDLNSCVLQIILSNEPHILCGNRKYPDEEAENIAELDNWVPEAIDSTGNPQERRISTIEFLLNLLESPSKLFKEYTNHMATTLLNKKNMDTSDECIELELLMNQFGEANFTNCKVMLIDISTSLYLSNSYAKEHRDKNYSQIEISPIIISYYSWPPLDNLPINLSEELKLLRDSFDIWHSNERSNKYLVWLFGNGTVELDIDIDGIILSFRVPELDALVISFFNDTYDDISVDYIIDLLVGENKNFPKLSRQNTVNIHQLSQRIKNSLNEWVSRKVILHKSLNVYAAKKSFNETSNFSDSLNDSFIMSNDTNVSNSQGKKHLHDTTKVDNDLANSPSEETPQEEKLYKSMITGMLANQGPAKIEHIHSRMCMFINYSKPISDLRVFLHKLHLQGVIFKNIDEAYYI